MNGMNETSEKVRLKFRVASLGETKWTEKWGVSLTAGEEFHVTDKLLKLPFLENPPKTVCIFSVDGGALRFQQLDTDRAVTLNGQPEKDCSPRLGDKIQIGETISIEVLLAPTPKISVRADESNGPKVRPDVIPEMFDGDSKIAADGPTLTMTFAATTATTVAAATEAQISMGSHSLEINEPSLKMARPELAPQSKPAQVPKFIMPAEPKIILAKSPHTQRDDSLEERMAAMTETELGAVKPVYSAKAQLGTRQSFSEKILAAVASVLRRDELNPPNEKFPLDKDATNPGFSMDRAKISHGEYTASPQVSRVPQKPWIPAAAPAGARLRGRALVFLVAASGALMLAVGVLKITSQFGKARPASSVEPTSDSTMNRGVPIEFIEEKVRKMRRRR